MGTDYLHNREDFHDLISKVSDELSAEGDEIPLGLVEKDYWIMHVLYGLREEGRKFFLKGGTSLSKGYKIIHRFSEDIDVRIEPPPERNVYIGRNHNKEMHLRSREEYYDWLAEDIKIDGIISAKRDKTYDDEKFRSGGIKLSYKVGFDLPGDAKDGILLEAGFDVVSPYEEITISSWAYEHAKEYVDIKDNRAKNVPCYNPGYTLVEKLQALSTKFRKQQENQNFPVNFMRHYYDVYHLLGNGSVQEFISTEDYQKHKDNRFRSADNKDISKNQAFQLNDADTFEAFKQQYLKTISLYYKDKPEFEDIMQRIRGWSSKL